MDLIRRIRGWAVRRPRILLVAAPGALEARWAVEAGLDRRGWAQALSPAETDLLLVVGHPGPRLSEAVEVLWSQVPAPRQRARWDGDGAPGEVLDRAVRALVAAAERGPGGDPGRPDPQSLLSGGAEGSAGPDGDYGDGGHGPGPESSGTDGDGRDYGGHGGHGAPGEDGHADHTEASGTAQGGHAGHGDHEGMEHGGDGGHGVMDHAEHGGHDDHDGQDGMDHSGHGGHGDHGGDGGMDVAGLPMADTAPDRDGLELDRLTVSLGPVLPGWPTGLVLRAGLQGDVLTGVELARLDQAGPEASEHASGPSSRAALDLLAGFLLIAGWPTAAGAARRARDGLSSAHPAEREAARQAGTRLARRVARSRLLAWNLRGVSAAGPETCLLDRIRGWCAVAAGDDPGTSLTAPTLAEIAGALEGSELGAARLAVAGLGLHLLVPGRAREAAGV